MVYGDEAVIEIEVVDPDHRPVELQTTMQEVPNLRRARISSCPELPLILLFRRPEGIAEYLTEPPEHG
jgi:hypothetical protein